MLVGDLDGGELGGELADARLQLRNLVLQLLVPSHLGRCQGKGAVMSGVRC